MAVMMAITLLFIGYYEYSALVFIMTFLWGFQDGAVNTHCFEMLGFEFENNYEPYSIFNLLQALGAAFFLLLEALIDTREKYFIYTSSLCVLGLLSCGMTYFFKFKNHTSPREQRKKMKVIINSVTTMDSTIKLIEESPFKSEIDSKMHTEILTMDYTD